MAFLDPGAPPPTTDPNAASADALRKMLGQLTDQGSIDQYAKGLQQVGQQQKAVLGQGIQDRNRIMGQMRQTPSPQQPQLQNMPKAPPNDLQSGMQVFGTIAPWLGIFGSLLTRAPLISAMNSASAAIKGYQQGNKQAVEQNYDKWKSDTESAIKQNEKEIEQYNAARDKYGDKIDELKAELAVIAANNQDKLAMAAINQGNLDAIYGPGGIVIKRAEAAGKLSESLAKISGAGILSDDTLDSMADQYLSGDKSIFTNLGRGAQGAQNVVRLREKITQHMHALGMLPSEVAAKIAEYNGIVAGERTAGVRSANIDMAVNEAQNMMPIAIQASNAVDRSQYPSINSMELAVARGTGDQNVVRLMSATNALINIYARAISPTGVPTVSDKDHAREILDAAWSKGQFEAGIDQMWKEMQAAKASPGQVRGELRGAITGKNPPPDTNPTNPSDSGWKIEPIQ